MNDIISDFSTHPLVPGGLLASIIGDPQSRRTEPLENAALLTFNKLPTLDILSQLPNLAILANEQASEIVAADNQYVSAFKELCRRTPEVAQVTDCDRKAVDQLAPYTFCAKL